MGVFIFRVVAIVRHSIGCMLVFSCLAAMAQSAWHPTHYALQLEPLFASETIVGSLQMEFSLGQTDQITLVILLTITSKESELIIGGTKEPIQDHGGVTSKYILSFTK